MTHTNRDSQTDSKTGRTVKGPVARLEGIRKIYTVGGTTVEALKGITLELDHGLTVFSGHSGCGKSSLINILGALDVPSSGTVEVGGIRIDRLDEKGLDDFRRNAVGIVFQFFHLIPTLTVEENVALPAELAGVKHRDADSRARELLEQVGLTHRIGHRPHELSGGEIQRTAIARALINGPTLVLADEPTGNLDLEASGRVMQMLADITEREGVSAIVATHDPEVVQRADRIVKLQDGRVVDA
ncbi:ATP-binding cassette domain-containing protein [bacterium]|nr:ATP-binding cassette domain-containing protein [bacterium]